LQIESLNFGLSFKIVYCRANNHKNLFGYINTTELLVYMCGPHLEYAFSYSFGSLNIWKYGNCKLHSLRSTNVNLTLFEAEMPWRKSTTSNFNNAKGVAYQPYLYVKFTCLKK